MNDNAGTVASGAATGPQRASSAARTAVVWETLRTALAEFEPESSAPLEIVDAGGGTGGVAVPLAELGHNVTVVEPSPDSLAALERRATEAGVRVRALQGETRDLAELLPADHAHVVLVHNVLEYVDDPRAALSDVVRATRPGGFVSVLATNAVAAVLHRAIAGHLAEARRLLESEHGRWGANDPMPRRFTVEQLAELASQVGISVTETRGVRVFADVLPGRVLDGDPYGAQTLIELEQATAAHPVLSGIATQLHVLARR